MLDSLFLPADEPGDNSPAIHWLVGNTVAHFRAHQGWIESRVEKRP